MAMRDILFPECVITHMKAKSKEDALHQLYEVLLKNGKVKTSFYDAVLERERDYPTGLELEEYNAAIPHVVPAHVEHSAMGIAVLDTPVTFQRMDDDEATVDVNVIFNIALDGEPGAALPGAEAHLRAGHPGGQGRDGAVGQGRHPARCYEHFKERRMISYEKDYGLLWFFHDHLYHRY